MTRGNVMAGRGARHTTIGLGGLLALAMTAMPVLAQDVLIRNATVHTATERGTLRNADVLVRGGLIAAVGSGLSVEGITAVDARGLPLTPALFGGISAMGLEEVSIEEPTVDGALMLGDGVARPEFDVTLAYNPESVMVPVTRVEGIGYAVLSAGSRPGGSIMGGQGGVVRLDGSYNTIGPKPLFVALGGAVSTLSGSSRAGQWMLLDQMVAEARGRVPANSDAVLLTPAGRDALGRYLDGQGTVVVSVDRAADIHQLLRWSRRHSIKVAIFGGAEAWKLASQIAEAGIPIFVDSLANLPSDFDQIGATLENAARLREAGVRVSFSQSIYAAHGARKIRQHAGNAVANGLPWEDGFAGLTRVPAEVFGVADSIGTIEVGKTADLVLWSGDPLDVAHVALRIWFAGREMPMRSYQTKLRDRYLRAVRPRESGGLPRAYPDEAE